MSERSVRMNPESEQRIEHVLARAYRGIHHVLGWDKRKPLSADTLSVVVPYAISTYDYDVLTRLVFAAHEDAVRVEIAPAGPRHLKLYLSARQGHDPGLSFCDRHDTLDEAVRKFRSTTL